MRKIVVFVVSIIIALLGFTSSRNAVPIDKDNYLVIPGANQSSSAQQETPRNNNRSDNKQEDAGVYTIELAPIEEQYYYCYSGLPEEDAGISEKHFYDLGNRVNKALTYFKTSVERLSSYWFWNNYSFEERPNFAKLDDEYKIRYLLPFKARQFDEGHNKESEPNYKDYSYIVKLISQNRKYINMYELYAHFKPAVHSLIDKKTYDEKYGDLVKRLLIAYEDLDSDEKYERVNTIMLLHFKKSLSRDNKCEYCYTEDLSFFYDLLEPVVSEKAKKKLREIPYPVENGDNGSYIGNYATMWAYSFWNRRKLEGKKDEIHKLLETINDDYGKME